jgi:hypothetical protein
LSRHLPQFRSSKFTVLAVGGVLCVVTAAAVTAATWPSAPATPSRAAVQEAAAGLAAAAGHADAGRPAGAFDSQAADMMAFQPVSFGLGARVVVIRQAAARVSAARAQALAAREHAAHLAHEAHLTAAAQAAAAARAAAQQRAAQQAAAKQAAAKQAAGQQAAQRPTTTSGSPQQIAESMLGQFGWSSDQFSCLNSLWTEESGWNVSAENPSSGAYGIPQALPGSKMASAGPDWQTDAATQILWGLGYIQSTYGSPCAAWSHEEADGWY